MKFMSNQPAKPKETESKYIDLPDRQEQMALQDAATGSTIIPVIRLPAGTGLPEWVRDYLKLTVTDPIAGVTNVPDADTLYNLVMVDPEIIGAFFNELVQKDLEGWPDQIMLSGWPQVDENEIDEPPTVMRLTIAGHRWRRRVATVHKSDTAINIFEYARTQFVLEINPEKGEAAIARWDPKRHSNEGKNQFNDLPELGMTPPQVLRNCLEGDGIWGILENFKTERQSARSQGGASRRSQPQKTRLRPKQAKFGN